VKKEILVAEPIVCCENVRITSPVDITGDKESILEE